MTDETQPESLRSSVVRSFQQYHSDLHQRHYQQLEIIDKLATQVAKVRSSLLDAHSTELSAVRQLMRVVEWKISEADRPNNEEGKGDD